MDFPSRETEFKRQNFDSCFHIAEFTSVQAQELAWETARIELSLI